MDKLGAALRRVAKFLGGQRVDAPAASVSRLEDRHSFAGARQLAGRHQARGAGADDHEIFRMQWGRHARRSGSIRCRLLADMRRRREANSAK